jgi:hypothetical protein
MTGKLFSESCICLGYMGQYYLRNCNNKEFEFLAKPSSAVSGKTASETANGRAMMMGVFWVRIHQ